MVGTDFEERVKHFEERAKHLESEADKLDAVARKQILRAVADLLIALVGEEPEVLTVVRKPNAKLMIPARPVWTVVNRLRKGLKPRANA